MKDKITRDLLRKMQEGETVTVECRDGLDLNCQKNIAYQFQIIGDCKLTCKSDGLKLSVTKLPKNYGKRD